MADPTLGINIGSNMIKTQKMMFEIEQEAIAHKVSEELNHEGFPNEIEECGTKRVMIGMFPCKVANLKIKSTEELNYDDQCTFNLLKDGITKQKIIERREEMKAEKEALEKAHNEENK